MKPLNKKRPTYLVAIKVIDFWTLDGAKQKIMAPHGEDNSVTIGYGYSQKWEPNNLNKKISPRTLYI